MKTSHQLTPRKKAAIIELKKVGLSNRRIAKQLTFDRRAIDRFFKRYEQTGDQNRQKGSGPPRLSTERQDKTLKDLCLKNRFASAAALNKKWKQKSRVKVHPRTVNNRLLSMNLPARRPRKRPLKTEAMREKRLVFAQKYADWTAEDWKRVMFSDESWFQLMENGRRQFVRRSVGEALLPECVLPKVKHPLKVMIFGAIDSARKSQLVFIEGRVNAPKYQEILTQAGIPNFIAAHPHPSPLFMEDKAPAHRAASTKVWHQQRGIELLPDWPGNSPDLNPIENLWSQMKEQLSEERPTSAEGIRKVVRKVWNRITPNYLLCLYESMPRRMQAVIAAQGGHTTY